MGVFAVVTAKGQNWDHSRDVRNQPYWTEHAAFADGLVANGTILLGGPVSTEDDDVIALLAVQAADEHELRSVLAADPWTTYRVFRFKAIWPWTLWLDGRR